MFEESDKVNILGKKYAKLNMGNSIIGKVCYNKKSLIIWFVI